jgi:hypothetical protein
MYIPIYYFELKKKKEKLCYTYKPLAGRAMTRTILCTLVLLVTRKSTVHAMPLLATAHLGIKFPLASYLH